MRIGIIGYGKMGKAIEQQALKKGHEIAFRIARTNLEDLNTENLAQCDVAIEFTNPESAYKNILLCIDNDTPVISGSTGWLDRIKEVEQRVVSKTGCFLYASNFSLGVNVLFDLNDRLTRLLGKNKAYQIDIEEIHHTEKKDAPSGTAITLANTIIENNAHRYSDWNLDKESEGKIMIKAKREENVAGTHTIRYRSAIDMISLHHEAYGRDGFALGALLAAEYIVDKKGLFTMKDVLDV